MHTLSFRLKSLRIQNGLTQDELAAKFYISKSAISKYENGVHTPEFKLLYDIANFFNVSIDYLIGRTDTHSLFVNSIDVVQPISNVQMTREEKLYKLETVIKSLFENEHYKLDNDDISYLTNNILQTIEYSEKKKQNKGCK